MTTAGINGTLTSYPIAFETGAIGVIATDGGGGCYSWGTSLNNINSFRLWVRNVGVLTLGTCSWFSVGY